MLVRLGAYPIWEHLKDVTLSPKNNIRQLALEVIKLKKQKKSTKVALDNLLTAILGEDYES